jgi:hypothetical protein
MTATTDKLRDFCDANGLTIEATFVPFSRSRFANTKDKPNVNDLSLNSVARNRPKVNDLSLNWRVSLLCHGKHVLTTDYMAGVGHCPSYKRLNAQRFMSVEAAECIAKECETGRAWNGAWSGQMEITPDRLDVISSLVMDSRVLDYGTFEEWAEDFGFDPDSRKAEATYRACMEIALKMRAGLGETMLERMSEAFADY